MIRRAAVEWVTRVCSRLDDVYSVQGGYINVSRYYAHVQKQTQTSASGSMMLVLEDVHLASSLWQSDVSPVKENSITKGIPGSHFVLFERHHQQYRSAANAVLLSMSRQAHQSMLGRQAMLVFDLTREASGSSHALLETQFHHAISWPPQPFDRSIVARVLADSTVAALDKVVPRVAIDRQNLLAAAVLWSTALRLKAGGPINVVNVTTKWLAALTSTLHLADIRIDQPALNSVIELDMITLRQRLQRSGMQPSQGGLRRDESPLQLSVKAATGNNQAFEGQAQPEPEPEPEAHEYADRPPPRLPHVLMTLGLASAADVPALPNLVVFDVQVQTAHHLLSYMQERLQTSPQYQTVEVSASFWRASHAVWQITNQQWWLALFMCANLSSMVVSDPSPGGIELRRRVAACLRELWLVCPTAIALSACNCVLERLNPALATSYVFQFDIRGFSHSHQRDLVMQLVAMWQGMYDVRDFAALPRSCLRSLTVLWRVFSASVAGSAFNLLQFSPDRCNFTHATIVCSLDSDCGASLQTYARVVPWLTTQTLCQTIDIENQQARSTLPRRTEPALNARDDIQPIYAAGIPSLPCVKDMEDELRWLLLQPSNPLRVQGSTVSRCFLNVQLLLSPWLNPAWFQSSTHCVMSHQRLEELVARAVRSDFDKYVFDQASLIAGKAGLTYLSDDVRIDEAASTALISWMLAAQSVRTDYSWAVG